MSSELYFPFFLQIELNIDINIEICQQDTQRDSRRGTWEGYAFKNVFLCHPSPCPPWSLGPGITAPPSDMKLSGCCKHQTQSLSPRHFMIPDGKHRSRKLLTCGGHLEIQLCL